MNDDSQFQAAVAPFQALLRRFLIARLGNEADADDVLQETLLKLHGAFATGVVENPQAFAFTVARNLSVDFIRRASRARNRDSAYGETRTERSGDDFVDPTPNAEAQVEGREQIDRLLAALERLTPKVRQAFVLHKIDGFSYAEVAQKMGLSKSTVEKHMMKALRAVAEALT